MSQLIVDDNVAKFVRWRLCIEYEVDPIKKKNGEEFLK